MDWAALSWMFPPAGAIADGNTLRVITAEGGDFWNRTFYGFQHHNGHFLHGPARGDFTAELGFGAEFKEQYDQAGLMIRADESHWIKCGIEYVGGMPHLAVVVTNGMSDWSQMPFPDYTGQLDLRLTRSHDAVWVQYRSAEDWKMMRLAYFPPELSVAVGPMCCSPSRSGLAVRFDRYALTAPISKEPY